MRACGGDLEKPLDSLGEVGPLYGREGLEEVREVGAKTVHSADRSPALPLLGLILPTHHLSKALELTK